jgi:hypothetical protein
MAATKTNDQSLDRTAKGPPIPKAVPVGPSATDASPTHFGADGKGKGEAVSESTDQEPREVEQQRARDQDDPPAEPPSEQLQGAQTAGEDYSVLTVTQKKLIITVASLASLFSPVATAIYCQYPTFSNYAARINVNRPVTRYDIKGPRCLKYEDQYHYHALLGMFRSSFDSINGLTITGYSRYSASLCS